MCKFQLSVVELYKILSTLFFTCIVKKYLYIDNLKNQRQTNNINNNNNKFIQN